MFIIVNDGYLSLASPPDIIIVPSVTKYNLPLEEDKEAPNIGAPEL